MRTDRLALAAAATLLAAAPVAAQIPLNARALGMGGAYIGVARGQESLWENPANLGLPNSPHWSAAIPTISLGLGARGVELESLDNLRRFNELTAEERAALLQDVPAEGTGGDLELRAPLVSMQVRRFAFGLGFHAVGSHTVNRSIVDLVLNGFDRQKRYTIQNTEGFRAAYWDLAAAYGRRFGRVSVGATAHYFLPQHAVRSALVDVDTTYSVISGFTVPTDIRVTYAGVSTTGGGGFGVDLGAAMEPIPGLTVSASLLNVVNTMRFNEDDLELRVVTLDRNDYQQGDPEAILAEYNDSRRDYDRAQDDVQPWSRLADSVLVDADAGLPPVLRAGAAYRLGTGTTVAAAFRTQLQESRFGGLWDQQVSLGVQQRIPIVTLRAGFATDLEDGTLLSGGLTLGPLRLGIARLATGGETGSNGWVATLGIGGRSDTSMP